MATIVVHACQARKASSRELHFERLDYPQMDPPEWNKFITVANESGQVRVDELPLNYYGNLVSEYEHLNGGYIRQNGKSKKPSDGVAKQTRR